MTTEKEAGRNIMRSDPRGPTVMRALLIIAGVLIFGTTIYVILAGFLGISIATGILLAVAAFIIVRIVRRYFNRRRMDKSSTNQPFRSTGATRDWPQKYGKRRRKSYNAATNIRQKPQTSRLHKALSTIAHFAVKTLKFAVQPFTRGPMDKRLENRLHKQTRWSDEIYP